MNTESLIRCLERCSEDKNSCEQCERYEKNVGSMRCVDNLLAEAAETIKSLNADLKESNRIVVQLRKQWQDAEMFICTMCGHLTTRQMEISSTATRIAARSSATPIAKSSPRGFLHLFDCRKLAAMRTFLIWRRRLPMQPLCWNSSA